jgi:ankyrin repeat protein
MELQIIDILCEILSHLDNLNLTRFRKVNKTWKNIIENKILFLEIWPSIEHCIIAEDYYHFTKYINASLNLNQRGLIKITENKIFNKLITSKILFIRWYNDSTNLLMYYSRIGDLNVVKFLLETDKENIKICYDDYYPLRMSSSEGHTKIVELLIEYGSNIHALNDYPLRHSSACGHIDIVRLLINKGANINAGNSYAFRYAAFNGHTEIVKLLLEKGVNIHANNNEAFFQSLKNGHIETIKLFINKLGSNVLEEALRRRSADGSIEIVKLLLDHGVNIHAMNDVALYRSVFYNHNNIDMVHLLLERGADPNAQNGAILRTSIENGYTDITELLIKYGGKNEKINEVECIIS